MSLAHDIALTFSPYWSHRLAKEVIKHFPQRSDIFETSLEELYDRLPRYKRWAEDFVVWREKNPLEHSLKTIENNGLTAINIDDGEYPKLLKEIHDPPLVLYVKGFLPKKESWCAIVGAREATAYGKIQAFKFGKELIEHGVGVVTGLAYGIDEEAIKGACKAGGAVIAVLAGGHLHKTEREKVLEKLIVASGGAMVSECTPTIEPKDFFFPIRNRIIAGIGDRTLVIEAKLPSGSLITAQEALEQGREVFAIPGPITNATSKGCHKLLREGASLCESVHDIVDKLGEQTCGLHTQEVASITKPTALTDFQSKLWDFLKEPRSFDSLVEYAKEKGSEVAGILNIWEIEGYLALKNGRYHLVPYEHSPHR